MSESGRKRACERHGERESGRERVRMRLRVHWLNLASCLSLGGKGGLPKGEGEAGNRGEGPQVTTALGGNPPKEGERNVTKFAAHGALKFIP